MGDGFEKVLDEGGGLGLREGSMEHAVEKRVGLAEVHYDGEIVVVLEDMEDLEDVGVRREEGHEFGFVLEAVAVGGVKEEGFVDEFAGVGLVGEWVEAAEDGAETTATNLLANLVIPL